MASGSSVSWRRAPLPIQPMRRRPRARAVRRSCRVRALSAIALACAPYPIPIGHAGDGSPSSSPRAADHACSHLVLDKPSPLSHNDSKQVAELGSVRMGATRWPQPVVGRRRRKRAERNRGRLAPRSSEDEAWWDDVPCDGRSCEGMAELLTRLRPPAGSRRPLTLDWLRFPEPERQCICFS